METNVLTAYFFRDLFEKGLCLPSGSNLIRADLKRIVYLIQDELNV